MQIKDYIQGNKHGKEANKLEREAMNDEFLQEALEGFDAVPGNHTEIIERLEKKIISPTQVSKSNRKVLYICSAAASVLLLIGFGVYFMMDTREQKPTIAMVQTVEYNQMTNELSEAEPPSPVHAEEMEQATPVAEAEIQSARTLQRPIQTEEINLDQQYEIAALTDDDFQSYEMLVVTDSVVVQAQQIISAEDEKKADFVVSAEVENVVDSRAISAARAREGVANSMVAQTIFDEKEFEAYCLKNAATNICDSDSILVKVSFYIDASGKPINIKFDSFTCENAKKEMERLLSVSPAWTNVNRQITMTIKW